MAKLLIIEDEPPIIELLRHGLERAGHEVTGAANGILGLQLLRKQSFDLIFCDLFMPEMDGIETMRRIRSEFPGTKVIAVSGGGFDGKMNLLNIAKALGAVAVLAKPFAISAAVAAVEKALGEGK